MKLKLKMFIKIFGMMRINLTIATILKIPYFDKANKNVIGKLKDDTSSIAITQFVGFRSKCTVIKTVMRKVIEQLKE